MSANAQKTAFPLTRNDIVNLFEERGILPTAQRLEIAEILFSAPQHLSAEQIKAKLTATHTRVAKATVYNTLSLFTDKKIIKRVVVDAERVLYDSNTHPHYHIFNESTGELSDIDDLDIHIDRLPTPPAGQEITNVDIVIRTQKSKK